MEDKTESVRITYKFKMSNLTKKNRKLVRVFTVLTAVTTMLSLSGVAFLAPVASAVAPADFGLTEGNVISSAGSDDPDVYIVNEHGYKRLFLNPAIFGFYGHLGGFGAVKNVSPSTRDAFGTSGLFRNCEANDEKVYGVETTGEDVGMLHWVNTSGAQAVADDANFFKKVFCINNNEFNWYSKGSAYTSVNQVPNYSRQPGSSTTPGNVMASLAPANPSAKTITKNATGETLMVVRLSGTGTVQELWFKRGGPGATGDYDNLYIYDGARRLTSGRTPSSSDGTLIFTNLNVSVSGSKDLMLVADHSGAAGNVNSWELTAGKLTSGNMSGAPLMSNNFTISGSDSGTVTAEKTGSVSNPKVGQKNVQLSEFKLTSATEGAWVRRVQLFNGGTVKPSDISNLWLEVNGVKVATGYMTTDSYAVFDFGTPGYKIDKGNNRIFKLYGDVSGRKDETVKFYVEQSADIYSVGDQYGFGMASTISSFDSAAEGHSLTLEGGALTITFNGPTATNVGTDTSDTILAEFGMTAISNIEVKKLRLVLCEDTSGNGTYNDASDTDGGWSDITDIKVTDTATGQVLVGPADGSAFTTSEATGCPDGTTGAAKTFTDTFDLSGGVSRNLRVTGDIETANTDGSGNGLSSGDVIKVVLDGYGESDLSGTSGDLTVLKYAGTNTAVDDGDIVPNTDVGGNNMTVSASSLTLGLGTSPTSRTYVKGQQGVDVAGFTFGASLASEVKVTNVTISGYVADSGSTLTLGVGTGADSGLSVGNLVSGVMLYDGSTGTLLSNSPTSNNLNSSTGTIQFNNLNWTIPAGQTKTLLVKANLSTNATSGSSDVFSFDINATTDVTALDNNSNTINAGTSDPNGSTSPSSIMTVSNAGTLTVSAAPATPIAEAKYWGQQDTEFARYRFRADNDAFLIETLNLMSTDTAANVTSNVDQVKIQYTNKAGATVTAVGTLNGGSVPSVSFGFAGDNRPYVPKDSSMDIIVLANLKTKAAGATSEVNFSLDFSGGNADEFRAVGEGSGGVVDGSASGVANITANNMYVFRVFPKFTQETLAGGEPLGTKDVMKFTIKAEGLSDAKLLFDDPSSAQLKFEVVASGQTNSTMTANLYDASSGELLASTSITAGQSPSIRASATFSDWERDIEIQGGTSKTFRVEVAFQNFTHTSDYFQLVLQDNENSLVKYVDGARSNEDQMVESVTSVFRLLPMNGTIFSKQ